MIMHIICFQLLLQVKWLKKYTFGGIMVWALPLDDFKGKQCNHGETYPLLRSIVRELNKDDIVRTAGASSVSTAVADETSATQNHGDNIPVKSKSVLKTVVANSKPLSETLIVQGDSLLKSAKDKNRPVAQSSAVQRERVVKPAGQMQSDSTGDTVLSDSIINPITGANKASPKSDKTESVILVKTESSQRDPLVQAASTPKESTSKIVPDAGKGQSGPIGKTAKEPMEGGTKPTSEQDKQQVEKGTPQNDAVILSKSISNAPKMREDVHLKITNLESESNAPSESVVKPASVEGRLSAAPNAGQHSPLMKTPQSDGEPLEVHKEVKHIPRIVPKPPKDKKTVAADAKTIQPKTASDVDPSSQNVPILSSTIVTNDKATITKIGSTTFKSDPPVYSAPDTHDLQVNAANKKATDSNDLKQASLSSLKDASKSQVIKSEKIVMDNGDRSDINQPANGERATLHTSKYSSTSVTTTVSPSSVEKNAPSVGTQVNTFKSRKLFQMTDTSSPGRNEGQGVGGFGGMINSLFGMLSGFTRGNEQGGQDTSGRDNFLPRASQVTESPTSFDTRQTNRRESNFRSRQRQRFQNERRERLSTSQSRPTTSINGKDRTIDQSTNSRDQSLTGQRFAGNRQDQSNRLAGEQLINVSPFPPTSFPAIALDPLDTTDTRRRTNILRNERTRGVLRRERINGRGHHDGRAGSQTAPDTRWMSEQLSDSGQNSVGLLNPDHRFLEEANPLLPDQFDMLGQTLHTEIRDPALIQSREPGLVDALRQRISDTTRRSRANVGNANTQTSNPLRNRERLRAENRPTMDGRFQNTNTLLRNDARNTGDNMGTNIRTASSNNELREFQRNARRQRTAVGVQRSTSDSPRGPNRQRSVIGVPGAGPTRQRTAGELQGTANDLQRIPTSGIDRQRTAIGSRSVVQESQRPVMFAQGADNNRQRARTGVQRSSRNRQPSAIGVQRTALVVQRNSQRAALNTQGTTNSRTRSAVRGSGNELQRTSVGSRGRHRTAIGVHRNGNQGTGAGGQKSVVNRQRTADGVNNSRNNNPQIVVRSQRSRPDRRRTLIGRQSRRNTRQRSTLGSHQGSANIRKRPTIGVQNTRNNRSRNDSGIQNTRNDRQRSLIGFKSSLTGADSNLQLPSSRIQNTPTGTMFRDSIRTNEHINSNAGSPGRGSKRVIAVSENNQRTPTGVLDAKKSDSVSNQLQNLKEIKNSIEGMLAQLNALQHPVETGSVRQSGHQSIQIVPLTGIDNFVSAKGPSNPILNETGLHMPVASLASRISGLNAGVDIMSGLKDVATGHLDANQIAAYVSSPMSPSANTALDGLIDQHILSAMTAQAGRQTRTVAAEPIFVEIQPHVIATEPSLANNIADVLVQLLRDNLLTQNTPLATKPSSVKQGALQTPNEVLVSSGEQPKDFPPITPASRRQLAKLATNETVVANNTPKKPIGKADVLWKWEV